MLNQTKLKELLHYCPDTGIFTWKITVNREARQGMIAGSSSSEGYIFIGIEGKCYKAHRLAFLYMEGSLPDISIEVDHKDGIKYNNKWGNLRKATKSNNLQNSGIRKDNTTGIKGLSFKTNKYKGKQYNYYGARIWVNGIRVSKYFRVGEDAFITADKAKEAAIQWLQNTRNQYHKEFANHG